MTSITDLRALVDTDGDVVVLRVLANDPRECPTEAILIVTPADGLTLVDLEAIPQQLKSECGWGVGFEENLSKRAGGIGSDGPTTLELVLGVVGAVPTVLMLLDKLKRGTPACPNRENAWEKATWAVALQYASVERVKLRLLSEIRHEDHWEFTMSLSESSDQFSVEVFGNRSTVVAIRVTWTNGDPWGRRPGLVDPA
jgi:hypothetical protein